jgi:hypothetical protein
LAFFLPALFDFFSASFVRILDVLLIRFVFYLRALHEELGMKKFCSAQIPQTLNASQMAEWIPLLRQLLQCVAIGRGPKFQEDCY